MNIKKIYIAGIILHLKTDFCLEVAGVNNKN